MHIHDLENDVELDSAAMARISGGISYATSPPPTEPGIGGHGWLSGDIEALISSHMPAMPAMPAVPSYPTPSVPECTTLPQPGEMVHY